VGKFKTMPADEYGMQKTVKLSNLNGGTANIPLKSEKMTFYPDWYRIRLHLPPAFRAAQH
jgi:hypothetical protein